MKGNNKEKNSYVRGQILNTLLEMMKEQDFHDIVISALTERACVGRSSFYRNYTGKEDVLRQEAERLALQWKKGYERQKHTAPTEILIALLDFYQEHAVFYLALYQAGLSEIVLGTLLQQTEISPELPNAAAYLRSSVAYMIFGWVIEWMKRGMQESGTELAKMIANAQQNGIS
ncbi:MAG: TetR/AcrR family transcriptional regulator [Oscillospiraceae bacterium]|nr:TetR/AcrR family transcriptional regulator [Oscillospiraceae bacterium]